MFNKKRWSLLLVPVIATALLFPVSAQEEELFSGEIDEDELFGGDEADLFGAGEEMVTVIAEEETGEDFETLLLQSEGVEWGGELSFSFSSGWYWENAGGLDLEYIRENFTSPDQNNFSPALGLKLDFNARPTEDFRVLGKLELDYLTGGEEPASYTDIFRIYELFADYNWGDKLFFRVGKHMINWGVGYFFSPADVFNLDPINPEDPEATREGPLSMKVNYPLGLHNFYLYLVANGITDPGSLAYAPRMEFVLGNTELGLGAYLQPNMAVRPRLAGTVTTSLLDINLFAETVLSFGAEKLYLEESATEPLGLAVVSREDELFFEGTLGFLYLYNNDEQTLNLSASGQYLYSNKGYPDLDLIDTYALSILALLGSGAISQEDLWRPARHYGALNLNFSDIMGSDFSLGALGLLSADGSWQIAPSLGWNPASWLDVTMRVPFSYGDPGSDYAPLGNAMAPMLKAVLFEHTEISFAVPLLFSKEEGENPEWLSGGVTLSLSLAGATF